MHDFLYFSESQSPIFLYNPRQIKSKSDAIIARF